MYKDIPRRSEGLSGFVQMIKVSGSIPPPFSNKNHQRQAKRQDRRLSNSSTFKPATTWNKYQENKWSLKFIDAHFLEYVYIVWIWIYSKISCGIAKTWNHIQNDFFVDRRFYWGFRNYFIWTSVISVIFGNMALRGHNQPTTRAF